MKLFKIFVLVFFLFAIRYSLYANPTHAQECANISNSEFHSLRPYPTKPCLTTTENYAKFCGNTLTLQSEITVPYQPGVDNCVPIAGGKVRCSYVKQGGGLITINLKNANLPIMGNTEDVTPNASPDMSDTQKVNDYVSWYLNGVINRAEYPFLDVADASDSSKLVDFSGPINKLLPQEIQFIDRINTINQARETRHNQIVGCSFKIQSMSLLGLIGQLLGVAKLNFVDIPFPCYFDIGLLDLVPGVSVVEHRLDNWDSNHFPPLRSEYTDYTKYMADVERWRGKSCLIVPLPGFIPIVGGKKILLCAENAFKENFYSQLFPYIPLSSTEDLEGNIKVDSFSTGSAGVTNITFSNQTPAVLFFPHIQESSELGSILQDTYISKDQQKDEKTGPDVAVEPPSSCTTVDVRSNKGDSLHAGSISGNLGYTASFTCDFDYLNCTGNPLPPKNTFCETEYSGSCVPSGWTCAGTFPNAGCRSGYKCGYGCPCSNPPTQTCSKIIDIALSTTSNTPKINDVWSRLVGGPTAIVKRMFPKLGTQIGTLKDIPGSTSVTYSGAQASSAELNLPHVGGISEYFLKGIQTILRPKGYGESISFGEMSQVPNKCNYTLSDVDAAIQKASSMYHIPTSPPLSMPLLRAIFEIEGIEFIADPKNYVCEENENTAAGIMQITKSTYNYVTCPEERLDNDLLICKTDDNKLSRCDVEDAMILAARTLLWKDGKIANCNATGPMSSDKMSIYNASCKYYGTFSPTPATINAAKSIPIDKRRQNGDMNYCDIICYKTGLCPPYP